ncbi:CHASE2 domain-containing protein, partial [Alphaproteobacteria bacterium]|nr:CHASE2 domain-containing protein [Alphaproteobacteria bacterium]
MAATTTGEKENSSGIFSRLFSRGERARGSGRVSRLRSAFSNERLIALAILIGVVAIRLQDPLPLETLRLKVFDYYQQLKPREIPKNSPIVIIDLDDSSLSEIGQWPWPRTTIALMLRRLFESGVAVVGFDIVFAEPDRMSGQQVAKSMPGLDDTTRKRLSKMRSNDEVLAEMVRLTKRVVLGQGNAAASKIQNIKPIPSSVFQRTLGRTFPKPETFVPKTLALVQNIPELEKAVFNTNR